MDLREKPLGPFRRHPWETARLRFFRSLLVRHDLLRPHIRVLDAGAGDGWFARHLLVAMPAKISITCWDTAYPSPPPAPEPGIVFTRDAPAGPFQLALLLDVLEHVRDDDAFLDSVMDRLEPGGRLLVSVPVWPRLMGAHDVALRHYRRYNPAGARSLLTNAGLLIQECGGLFHSLLAARVATVVLQRARRSERTPAPGLEWRWGAAPARLLDWVLVCDNAVSRVAARHGLRLPGLSWWALCQKS